jgi:hypothetical protein
MVHWQHTGIRQRRELNLLICLALTLGVGCSQQLDFPASHNSVEAGQQLPFARASEPSGKSPTHAMASAALPIGTALVVRLQSQLSSATCHAGEVFQAVLEEPIRLPDQSLLPAGATLTGTVLAVTPAHSARKPGYLRLALSSIRLNGKTLAVHTSSVFAKGTADDRVENSHGSPGAQTEYPTGMASKQTTRDAEFSTTRRLTFRLLEPLPLPFSVVPEMALIR